MSPCWMVRSGLGRLPLLGAERDMRARSQHHIGAAPGGIVCQLPAMPRACGVLRKQNVTGVKQEVLAITGLKIERSAQRNHQLAGGRFVPGESAARSGFLEEDCDRIDLVAERVATLAGLQLDAPFLEM